MTFKDPWAADDSEYYIRARCIDGVPRYWNGTRFVNDKSKAKRYKPMTDADEDLLLIAHEFKWVFAELLKVGD
ncbi:MAG: hypothetical protein AMS21_01190 [Gemmatimonas sp. SG8_38_2]|nr:MAG: hypothetical protein AMS21_01190 [Gemmatimonas sp. SG8_38_2]